MKTLSRSISIKVNIKQLALFLTIFLTSFWLFGCTDYHRTNNWKKTELLSRTNSFASLNFQWMRPFKINEYGRASPELMSENDLWAWSYGGEYADIPVSIQQTTDGGYIVAGWAKSFSVDGYTDIWILKLFSNGKIEWQKLYGLLRWESVNSIQQTTDGGYIVAGYTNSLDDAWILKLSPDGEIEWQKAYGGEEGDLAYSIQQTADGGYIVAGVTYSFGAEISNMWVLKLFPDGEIEWQKTYGGGERECANSVQQTADGGYVVAGTTESFGAGDRDIWILKLFPDGEIEWQKTYGGKMSDGDGDANANIQQTADGGYIISGNTKSFDAGSRNFWVLKLFPDGEIEWQKTYGGDFDKYLWSPIQQTADGGFILAGYAYVVNRGTEAWVLKLFPNGEIEWQKTYGGKSGDDARVIQQVADGGYIVAGSTESFGNGVINYLVLKISSKGDCETIGLTKDSNAIVSNTSVSPSDTNVIPINSDGLSRSTDVIPQESNVSALPITVDVSDVPPYTKGTGKKSGCFIATAAYSSPLHPYVRILRDFRDAYLIPSKLGRMLVIFYYKHSPSVADLIVKHKALKVVVRISLLPLIAFCYSILNFGPTITVFMLIFIFAIPIFFGKFYQRRLKADRIKIGKD